MDPVVVEMHTKSGLLAAIRASTVTLDEAGAATLDFIREHVTDPRTVPLCGNSIGTDRRFLATYLPEIENYLHYRSVDVSSVKELVKRWYPDLTQAMPRKAGSHRALDDIRSSIEELRCYRGQVFVVRVAVVGEWRLPALPSDRSPPAASAADARRRAHRVRRAGGAARQPTWPTPVPGPDEILVDVDHSAVNRADVLQRLGLLRRSSPAGGRDSRASSTPARSPRVARA